MPYQTDSPIAAGMGFAANYFDAQKRNQIDAENRKIQQDQAAQNAALFQLHKQQLEHQITGDQDKSDRWYLEHGLDPKSKKPWAADTPTPAAAAPSTPNVTAVNGPGGKPLPVVTPSGGAQAPAAPAPGAPAQEAQPLHPAQQAAIAQQTYQSFMQAAQKVDKQADDLAAAHPEASIPIKGYRDAAQRYRQQAAEAFTQYHALTKEAEDAATRDYEKSIKYPPNWNKLQPNDKIAYLQQRLVSGIQHRDKEVVDSTNAEIGRLQADVREGRTERHQQVLEGQGDQRLGLEQRRTAAAEARAAREPAGRETPAERFELHRLERDYDAAHPFSKPTPNYSVDQYRAILRNWNDAKKAFQKDPDNNPDPGPPPGAPASTAPPHGGGNNSGPPKTKVNPKNGKTYYLHADGNYYLTQ